MPRESAYYYRIARASLAETQNHLLCGFRRGYWDAEQYASARQLSEIAFKTTGGLLASRLALIKQEERQRQEARKRKTRKTSQRPRSLEAK